MISDSELASLHAAVEDALTHGDESQLTVVGYGEISLGVGWPADEPAVVAKRMPAFRGRAAFDSYSSTLARYVERLESAGITVLETQLRAVDEEGGSVIAYALQPLLPHSKLGPVILSSAEPRDGHPLIDAIVDAAVAVVGPRVGLDPQLANWGWLDGHGVFFDITTPFLRDERGADEMDFEILLTAYPRALRGFLRRFVAPRIIAQYHDRRTVLLDACGNLIKERLDAWIPVFLGVANRHLEERISQADVRRYYRSDARTWTWIQRVRRADRFWHRLRGRRYPFLIPREIAR